MFTLFILMLISIFFYFKFFYSKKQTPGPLKLVGLKNNNEPCPPHRWDKITNIVDEDLIKTRGSKDMFNIDDIKQSLARSNLLNRLACKKCGLIFGDLDLESKKS